MLRTMCKSKIHRVTVTEANVNYVGSITIDQDLMNASDIYPYEQVHVVNVTTGARLETYVITGEAGSGVICLNGAAAHHFTPGDIAIIMSYAQYTEAEVLQVQPRIVFVDANNKITSVERASIEQKLSDSVHV